MRQIAKRLRKLYAGVIYDAMAFDLGMTNPFVLIRTIRPLWRLRKPMVGHAFTCTGCVVQDGGALHDFRRIEMLDSMSPGCIQVIGTGPDATVAHYGDISAQLAKQRGAVGVVIDGYTRDAKRIERQRVPLFCRGVQPQDAYGKWEIHGWNWSVVLSGADGGVSVTPGDWIFGDADGVLVIPQDIADRVCRCAEIRAAREREICRKLRPGNERALYERYGRW